MVTKIWSAIHLVLRQSEGDDDHGRVVGDPADQEATHDEQRHLGEEVTKKGLDRGEAFISVTLPDVPQEVEGN